MWNCGTVPDKPECEVIQLEQVCAALSACNYDLRGVDVGEALRLHVLCKAVSDRTLYAEDRLLARMTQRDRTQRQINIEGQTHILLAERYRQLVVRLAEDRQCAQNNLNAVLCTRLLTNGTGNLEYHCVLDVRTLDAADLVTLKVHWIRPRSTRITTKEKSDISRTR